MENTILLDGKLTGREDLMHLRGISPAMDDLAAFLEEWFSPKSSVQVQTSGSTGAPKVMHAPKDCMRESARMTCSFLGLKRGDKALLCMPLKYIGAKMVVVRAAVWGLDLRCVQASSHPLRGLDFAPDFAAMTPAQVHSTLESAEEEACFRQIRHVIIGGGPIHADLGQRLCSLPGNIWSTYGMTETLSHIALRRLNGPEASQWYTPFKGVSVSLSAGGTLVIRAPSVCKGAIVTHDIAELQKDGRFRIIGRSDNIINSGGIKIQIEELEEQLRPFLPLPFQITAAPDEKFGEVVALLAETPDPAQEAFAEQLGLLLDGAGIWASGKAQHPDDAGGDCHVACAGAAGASQSGCTSKGQGALPRYSRPKHIFCVRELPRTGSGKPDRAGARALAAKLTGAEHA